MKRTTYIFIGLLVSGLIVVVATIISYLRRGSRIGKMEPFWVMNK